MTDSTTPGYIQPEGAAPVEDLDLFVVFQAMVVGVTGLDGTLVRPRWQPNPPTMPSISTDWVSVGVHSTRTPGFPYEQHVPAADGGIGADIMLREELLEVICGCYGPNAEKNAGIIRDGLAIGQNLDTLASSGVRIVGVEEKRVVPVQINNLWYNRVDLPVNAARAVVRKYPIRTIISSSSTINSGNLAAPASVP